MRCALGLCRQPRAVTGKTNLLPTSQSPKPIAAFGLLRRTLFSGSIPLIRGNKKASHKSCTLRDSFIIQPKDLSFKREVFWLSLLFCNFRVGKFKDFSQCPSAIRHIYHHKNYQYNNIPKKHNKQ